MTLSSFELHKSTYIAANGYSLSTEFFKLLSKPQGSKYGDSGMVQKSTVSLALPWSFPLLANHQVLIASNISLAQVFDWVIANWIDPIPGDFLAAGRSSMEKMANSVALEIYLSMFGVCPDKEQVTVTPKATNLKNALASEQMTLTLRTKGDNPPRKEAMKIPHNANMATKRSYRVDVSNNNRQDQFDSSIPPPLLSSSSISDPATQNDSKAGEAPEILRLRQYIPIDPQESLPPVAGNILAHWKLGLNPSLYNWEATRKELEVSDSDEATAISQSQRHRRKKRRERGETVSQPQAARGRLWGSSPGPTAAPMVVSSGSQTIDAPAEVFTATQEERGVFGSRKPREAQLPKKRRKAGF